jgi:hypothetical protein
VKLLQRMDCGPADLENAQEQVFGADRFMPATPRFLGGKDHHSPRTLGEPL